MVYDVILNLLAIIKYKFLIQMNLTGELAYEYRIWNIKNNCCGDTVTCWSSLTAVSISPILRKLTIQLLWSSCIRNAFPQVQVLPEYLKVHLQYWRELCLSVQWPGSIKDCFNTLAKPTRVSHIFGM